MSLLVDLTDATWTTSSATSGTGGCMTGTAGSKGACSAIPLIVPYLETGTPTFERYFIAHTTDATAGVAAALTKASANAAVNFGIDPNGAVFYVGVQPFYSAASPIPHVDTTQGGPDYFASTRAFTTNADRTITFQTGGSLEDNRVGYSAFIRGTGTGTTGTGTCKNENESSIWYYKSFQE